MKATVIYNATAGGAKRAPLDSVIEGLGAIGYYPLHRATDSEKDLDAALADAEGLVLVVGGDGSIRASALRLIGRDNVELSFIPAGTANNIAATLGVELKPDDLLHGLRDAIDVPLDVGRLTGPLGRHYFLEAFGCGVYADALAAYGPDEGKSIVRGLRTLVDILPGYEAYGWKLALDGEVLAGNFILLEALNTALTGPHLRLAPDALPGDGLLDVVTILEDQRHGFLEYASKMRSGELSEMENVITTRARRLELVWTGFPVHVDGQVLTDIEDPGKIRQARRVTPELGNAEDRDDVLAVEVLPAALTLRLPRAAVQARHARFGWPAPPPDGPPQPNHNSKNRAARA